MLLPATPGWVSLPVVVGGPRHSWLGSVGGVAVWCVVCGGGVLVGLWLVCRVVGPSPLLAEVPVCYSPPLLAGFRCRWRWAVPATPGWGPLAALVCGVWCVMCDVVRWCVGGVVAGVWCGWSLATPGGGSCVLLPATPGWVSLPLVVGGPRHSWLGSAGGGGVWCVVCGVLRWCIVGLWLVCGVVGPSPLLAEVPVCYSPPLLAGFRCRWWWAVPATPGWGPLAAVVCGVWCVVCGVWHRCVVGVVVGVWCGWFLATPGGGPCVLLPATPGWVSLPLVLGGPRHSWLGSAGGGGVWCVVCGGGVLVGLWLGAHSSFRTAAAVRVCSCACFAWPGRAGRPPGRVLVRLTFSFGRFVFLLCLAPSGLGLPLSLWMLLPFHVGCFSRPPAAWLSVRSRLVCVSRLAVGCSLVVAPPPPSPFCVSRFLSLLLGALVFFDSPSSSSSVHPLRFPAPGALGLGACVVCFVGLRLLGSPCACPSFVHPAWLLAALAWLLPPPPLCVSRFSFLPLGAVCRVVLCVPGCGAAPRCCALCRPMLCCRVLCCARLVPLPVAPCPLALPVALGPCALRRCVLRCSPALCALCCVCFVVARWCLLLFAAVPCAVCVSGCCAVRSLCSLFCAVLCFAVLVRSRCAVCVVRAVAGAWCCGALLCVVLFPVVCCGAVLGLVARGCLLVACFGGGVPVWPRGLLSCGWCGSLWCPAFLCRVLWCCAVAWCCAVVLCCRVAVLLGLGRSPPLLAGVRWRRCCVVCGVWRWCVGGLVAGVWCGWSLATPGGGSCVLLPATPGWVSLPVVVGGPRHSWLGSVGGVAVWCVVCGGGVLVGLWLVCGVVGPSPLLAEVPVCYSPPLLAGFRCRWRWAVPATPGWGPLAALVCGVWCVVCDVWRWCVGGVVAGVWCGWSLATLGGGSCVLLPATPGWVSLPVVVGGPRHSWLGSAGGGGVWCVVCGGGVLVGLWLVCGVVGPSQLLAEVPVCYSPPLLAGFRCRWWWAVPATPGWGPLAALLCGVWCVAVVCWWGCGWCVVWLVPRHSWRRLLCATPRHSWLGFAAGGGGRSPPLLAGVACGVGVWCVVCGVWCVVCGGGVLVGLWLVCGVVGPSPLLAEVPVCYSPPPLAGFRCLWWWAVPDTPGWGPLAAVVCGVWCVVCGGGVLWGCGWCVVWLVPRRSWRRSLCATPRHSWLGFAAGGGERSPPLLAGVRWRRWCVVCGVSCVMCGGGVLLGLWLVCGVVGPSPLLAEVPVCYSPPLLAGFRCRWWWAVPATPGWGPLTAVVCGVWCVGGVPRHSWRRFLCATPRHSWLGFAPGGGGRSPPLLAGVRWRRCCVVCGVWRWCVGGLVAGVSCGWSLATPGGGSCVLLPATPGWVSLPVAVGGPRHSWLGSACGVGVWCVVCDV